MRKARVVAEKGEAATYHCVTRVVERRCAFGKAEKEKFMQFLREYEEFCGVRLLAFCVMSNHLHVLVHVPAAPEKMPDDAELVRLVARADLSHGAARLERELAQLRKARNKAGLKKLRKKFLCRMWNISKFMQAVKQRFTQWFNGLHKRKGTLWEGRFKSTLVEDTGQTLSTLSAYIDLNPVRAGMVDDPAAYRWCGYAEAQAGGRLAREALKRVVLGCLADSRSGETEAEEAERLLARYRMYLFENGQERLPMPTGEGARRGIDPERVAEVIRQGGRLSFYESLRCRNRYFADGGMLGSKGFAESMFLRYRHQFGARRKTGACEMRAVDFQGLFVTRALRDQAVFAPCLQEW